MFWVWELYVRPFTSVTVVKHNSGQNLDLTRMMSFLKKKNKNFLQFKETDII